MTATATTTRERTGQAGAVRTYGGWRRRRGLGLWGLGTGETLVVLASVVVPLVTFAVAAPVALWMLPPAALAVAAATVRVQGVPVTHVVVRRVRWWWARRQGYTDYLAGVAVDHEDAWRLPGALAATRLLSVADVTGRPYGLVWHQRSGEVTATVRCAALSMGLVSPEVVDTWVGAWHSWLARLGHEPMVAHVAVTVDTAPEPGSTLADRVDAALVDDAPSDARRLLADLVDKSPKAAADVETRVSITFDPARSALRLDTQAEQVGEVDRLLHGLESALAGCGVTVLGRATTPELVAMVRRAYDPASRGAVASALARGDRGLLEWGVAGPVAAQERWASYRHDSGVSASLVWQEAPRQLVTAGVLEPLLRPHRHPTRVTMLYRPMPAGAAARHLETEVAAADFRAALRRKQQRDSTARDEADRDRALQAAREEAEGSGVIRFGLYVTVTAPDDRALQEAVAMTTSAADAARVQLRPLYGAQQLGFQTTLPAGVYPPALAGKWRR